MSKLYTRGVRGEYSHTCAGGRKLFVPVGANAPKSCVKVRLRRKEPTRRQPGGADKGHQPKNWKCLVGQTLGDQPRNWLATSQGPLVAVTFPHWPVDDDMSPSTGWCLSLFRRTALPRVPHGQGFFSPSTLLFFYWCFPCAPFFPSSFSCFFFPLVRVLVLAADPRCSGPRILVDFGWCCFSESCCPIVLLLRPGADNVLILQARLLVAIGCLCSHFGATVTYWDCSAHLSALWYGLEDHLCLPAAHH